MLGDSLDTDGSSLMRLEQDGPSTTSSPFILAVEVERPKCVELFVFLSNIKFIFRGFVFEVWCEKSKLFGNLDMSQAIAGFIHLAFVFDLKYAQVCF